MKYTREVLELFLSELEDVELPKWESDFVASLSEQLEARGTLSEKQIDVLDRIYAERTP